jgi:hypothetical protein
MLPDSPESRSDDAAVTMRWLQSSPRRIRLYLYSTVTLFARLRGLSTSVPRATAVW